jgi:integrase
MPGVDGIAVFYFTGLRRRQLAGLRRADLDFTEGIIHDHAIQPSNIRGRQNTDGSAEEWTDLRDVLKI